MSAPRAVPTPHTSEADFQRDVIASAKLFGYLVNHVYRGKVAKGAWRTNTTVKGWPDLVFVKPGDHFYAELKKDGEQCTAEQLAVHERIRESGVDVYVWAPRDWESIVERLAA